MSEQSEQPKQTMTVDEYIAGLPARREALVTQRDQFVQQANMTISSLNGQIAEIDVAMSMVAAATHTQADWQNEQVLDKVVPIRKRKTAKE